MSEIMVQRKADGMLMSVNKGVISAFLNNGWEVYVEPVAIVTKASEKPAEGKTEETQTEVKKTRGRRRTSTKE